MPVLVPIACTLLAKGTIKPVAAKLFYTVHSIIWVYFMFLTFQEAKIDQFGLFGPDPSAWSYVEHTIHRPWFYVATTSPQDDFDICTMTMISNESVLISLLNEAAGAHITNILLVTPHHINQQGRWVMEQLEYVYRYAYPNGFTFVYGVEGGITYIYGDEGVIGDEGRGKETLYLATRRNGDAV